MLWRNAERKAMEDAAELGHDMEWETPRSSRTIWFLRGACKVCGLVAFVKVTPREASLKGAALVVSCLSRKEIEQ